ncbi:MAG: TetR/AcrR family transcriptional regulator [Clostridia bacterium]|nr:TetR/AcrR family transcriptional regulator [Clostridia bacterium]
MNHRESVSAEDRYGNLRKHSAESNTLVRDCLKTALLTLMKERSYKDLSVSELCRKAGVSRMAFYRNYRIINDLFREAAEDLNSEIVHALGSPFREGTGSEWYEQTFQLIQTRKEEVSIMLQEDLRFTWMQIINALAVHDPDFPTEKKIQRLIWCGGFENIVAHWLSHGTTESPKEMAAYCVRYLPVISVLGE